MAKPSFLKKYFPVAFPSTNHQQRNLPPQNLLEAAHKKPLGHHHAAGTLLISAGALPLALPPTSLAHLAKNWLCLGWRLERMGQPTKNSHSSSFSTITTKWGPLWCVTPNMMVSIADKFLFCPLNWNWRHVICFLFKFDVLTIARARLPKNTSNHEALEPY